MPVANKAEQERRAQCVVCYSKKNTIWSLTELRHFYILLILFKLPWVIIENPISAAKTAQVVNPATKEIASGVLVSTEVSDAKL